MTSSPDLHRPGSDEIHFLPLGGSGEIGMNLNLYGHAGKWLMVDLGISFGDETMPGVDVIMPDPTFIRDRRDDLVGLVLTHAHEDHIGAVQYLWPELRCPVYATPFTASVLRAKLVERNLATKVEIIEVPLSGRFRVGPFDVELITVTHSVLEPNALVLRTPLGAVLHTGDWKLDPDPVVGATTDEAALRRLGDEGVLAMVCDSTNAMVPGSSGSEAAVRDSLVKLFATLENRIAISCFATNVARLESIATAAAAADRNVALVGRSLWRINEAARANGYLKDVAPFLSERDAGFLPRDRTVLICTGSQGEPRSALSRIAADDHPEITLERGDTVIFSSREIPGNERAIGRVQNMLIGQGVEVITADTEFVHVSGHPARDELTRMYQWVRPKLAVPIHGEIRHQTEHALLARKCQVPDTIIPENGSIIRLVPGPAEVVGQVQHGRLALDGKRIVPLDAGVMRGRHRMMYNGAAVATLVMNAAGELVSPPQVTAMGVVEGPEAADILGEVAHAVGKAVEELPQPTRLDDEAVRQAARIAVRRAFNASQGKKPLTEVHLVRL
ncbi:beta-lactamase [Skermanella stibiiresistens SB22]|uniref:Beta-lactamase n=1 Tax=Skermanella stibiiresistens SB22 TaxID=1385369 RepID=W9HE35_9PROT|nr:ribonuclease J [Skermanella stibiiresistens]EWY42128.1 beta-lactamase [Skermanella stibiiresistens SB22]